MASAESELPCIITKEVCVKQTKLYTVLCCQSTWYRTSHGKKPLWLSHLLVVCTAMDREQGHTSWPIACLAWCTLSLSPAWICPRCHMLLPYLTSPSASLSLQCLHPVCSSPLLTSVWAGRIWAAKLPSAELSPQRSVQYHQTLSTAQVSPRATSILSRLLSAETQV